MSISCLLKLVPKRKLIYPNRMRILEKFLENFLHSRSIQKKAFSQCVYVLCAWCVWCACMVCMSVWCVWCVRGVYECVMSVCVVCMSVCMSVCVVRVHEHHLLGKTCSTRSSMGRGRDPEGSGCRAAGSSPSLCASPCGTAPTPLTQPPWSIRFQCHSLWPSEM